MELDNIKNVVEDITDKIEESIDNIEDHIDDIIEEESLVEEDKSKKDSPFMLLIRGIYKRVDKPSLIMACISVIAITIAIAVFFNIKDLEYKETLQVGTYLSDMVEIDKLSTFKTVYTGVVAVKNEKNEKNVDYYLKYKTNLIASMNFSKVQISDIDEDANVITFLMPKMKLDDPKVQVGENDYDIIVVKREPKNHDEIVRFLNSAKEDAMKETANGSSIILLAKQNAEKIVEGLLKPFIQQLDGDYEIKFKWEDTVNE